MGAWGGGIFESDFDIDSVCQLREEVGTDLNIENPDPLNEFKCWVPSKEEKDKVRAHLDTGNFDRVFAKHQNSKKTHLVSLSSEVGGIYMCILLAASAMKVGAKISQAQKDYIRSKYKSAGLMLEGIEQIGKALDDYKNGVPYRLIEPDRSEAKAAKKLEDERAKKCGGPIMLNHLGARYHTEGVPTPDFNKVVQEMMEGKVNQANQTPASAPSGLACAMCKQPESAAGTLKKCGKCKKILYCDRECQKKHWKSHKKVCASMANASA